MATLALLVLILANQAPVVAGSDGFEQVFAQGTPFADFAAAAVSHRSMWTRASGPEDVPAALSSRFRHAGAGLRVIVVAEDWCVDSANTVPLVARLAEAAGVEMRIVDRRRGRPLLERFRTSDGRSATPLIVLIRAGSDARAWVERPKPLQDLFAALQTDPAARQVLSDRQRWYDEDGGRTALEEIVRLAEQGHAR